MPRQSGTIAEGVILGDLYQHVRHDACRRPADDEITFFKNGGVAHLDLMVVGYNVRAIACDSGKPARTVSSRR